MYLFIPFWFFTGVGKTSLVNLITKGTTIAAPSQTVGCAVDVKVRPQTNKIIIKN